MTRSQDAWKTEEQRQSQILAEAINKAITDAGAGFEAPMLNAVGGALVTNIASVLASISDHRQRKAFRKALDDALPHALAIALSQPQRHVQTVIIGGVRQ